MINNSNTKTSNSSDNTILSTDESVEERGLVQGRGYTLLYRCVTHTRIHRILARNIHISTCARPAISYCDT